MFSWCLVIETQLGVQLLSHNLSGKSLPLGESESCLWRSSLFPHKPVAVWLPKRILKDAKEDSSKLCQRLRGVHLQGCQRDLERWCWHSLSCSPPPSQEQGEEWSVLGWISLLETLSVQSPWCFRHPRSFFTWGSSEWPYIWAIYLWKDSSNFQQALWLSL